MLKNTLFLFLFLNSISIFSQNTLVLDSLFTKEKVTTYLDYYHDVSKNETIESINKKAFQFYGDKTFPGELDQKFWFKLQLKKTKNLQEDFYFLLNTVSIGKITIYQNTGSGYNKHFEFIKNGRKNIEIPVNFSLNSEYVFEVFFTKSIYFPIEVVSKQSLDKLHKTNIISYSLYYGFVLLVLLINAMYYWHTKESFFFYYILLTLSIALILFELDGFLYWLIGNAKWILYVDVILHTFLLICLLLFTKAALQLKTYMPKLIWFGAIIFILNTLSFLIYLRTDSILWYSLGEFFNLIGLLSSWIIGLFFLRKLVIARFVVIGYTVIQMTSLLYVLPSEFGLVDLGLTPTSFKIGSALEMLIFLYAISYRHKRLSKAKEKLEIELESHKKKLLEISENAENMTAQKAENFYLKFNLTLREIEVLNFIIEGKKNKDIAKELFLSEATVKYHCSNLYTKAGIKNRGQLVALFNSFITKQQRFY